MNVQNFWYMQSFNSCDYCSRYAQDAHKMHDIPLHEREGDGGREFYRNFRRVLEKIVVYFLEAFRIEFSITISNIKKFKERTAA